ncbi:hypothetical protein KIN34_07555 [Cellulomonas sp. DKR-3]|uniref:Uncharacterized protein n=1 Tax=Cellulomonas fulva TaxID=2835530 RepID=A0ABS5TYB4_9CELL|nr:hypothetical protein [Cellulomonas fulva]MBT0994139.1 hypothetical protein [Cellulomonas fulva]
MSTSDADGTRRPDDSTHDTTAVPDPAAPSPAPTDPRADETAVQQPVQQPVQPAADETAVQQPVPDEPGTDTGKHAAVRPTPVPPPPAPVRTSTRAPGPGASPTAGPGASPAASPVSPQTAQTSVIAPGPVTSPTPAGEPAPGATTVLPATAPAATAPATPVGGNPVVAPTTAAPTTATPTTAALATATPGTAAPRTTTEQDPALFPEPNAPRSTSVGTHVLGVLVGLVLTPLAVGVLLLGQSRILAAQLPSWDAAVDVTGIVLVSLGLLALGWVALLAVWTPAAPITGGIVLTVAGVAALALPETVQTQTLRLLDSTGWQTTITQVTVAGTSGTLVVAGFLVLVAGLVAALAHRRGVKLGTFRERHR